MRVVFNTNIFISAFLVPASQAEEAFLLARHRAFDLYTSVAILAETAQSLRAKFHLSEDDIRDALKLISRAAVVLRPKTRVNVLKDAPDNRILECAVDAAAESVVTGDRHMLKLKTFRDVPIVRLADFLRMFPQGSPSK